MSQVTLLLAGLLSVCPGSATSNQTLTDSLSLKDKEAIVEAVLTRRGQIAIDSLKYDECSIRHVLNISDSAASPLLARKKAILMPVPVQGCPTDSFELQAYGIQFRNLEGRPVQSAGDEAVTVLLTVRKSPGPGRLIIYEELYEVVQEHITPRIWNYVVNTITMRQFQYGVFD